MYYKIFFFLDFLRFLTIYWGGGQYLRSFFFDVKNDVDQVASWVPDEYLILCKMTDVLLTSVFRAQCEVKWREIFIFQLISCVTNIIFFSEISPRKVGLTMFKITFSPIFPKNLGFPLSSLLTQWCSNQ